MKLYRAKTSKNISHVSHYLVSLLSDPERCYANYYTLIQNQTRAQGIE